MNAFYQKLTQFGSLVRNTSRVKNLDMANYFTVMLPAHPVIKNVEEAKPSIRFENKCPRAVKREIAGLWKMVFGASVYRDNSFRSQS